MRLPLRQGCAAWDRTWPLEANEPINVKSSNLLLNRRSIMKEERIIIVDEGINEVTPEARMCCMGPYMAFRG
jgi:hypothetical protein